jgi:outer membrane biosynthesis protein TonB
MDRAEATGFGVAFAGHALLLGVLSLGFANATTPPLMNEPMEVSFVDEIGLTNASPEPTTEPAAQSMAPEIGAVQEPVPEPPPKVAPPEPAPPQPKAAPAPPAPKPVPKLAMKPAPAKPAAKAPAKPAPKAAASEPETKARGSRLGKDFLSGLGSDPEAKSTKAPGAVMSAVAMAGIQSAIRRQIQPCADRQVDPGPGANRITVKLNLRLNRDGSLARRPAVVSTVGVDDENSRYEKRVSDLAIAAFTGCSPLRGLPDELYETARGGWSNFNMNYKLPG